ncbi:unnamed protein product [Phytophthora lilii]|uniref:Unnamed protein product n=1 Tax=Phytophthora lilii TaxID=2077276 RepID=A0A9W6XFG7_9STRA|nr:unnamed protein product [Phytophthora lilii]
MGWWSAEKFEWRVRMRTLVNGAINDSRTRILLDTGANVSVISERYAKILRLRDIPNHGRCMEVQGITKGKTATSRRASVKITLGWERVYVFDVWIMDHNAGVDVVLGTDFMIPAGVRLDLFNATAKLPDEVMVPLIKTQNMIDETEGTATAATDDSRRLDSPHRDVCADDYSVLQAETSPRTSHEPHRQTSKLPSPPTSGGLARQPLAVEKPAYTTPTGILQRPPDDSEDEMSSADDWSNDNDESVAAMGDANLEETHNGNY